jgi:STE24 endopeptidase
MFSGMTARRWRLAAAVLAAVLIAEGAVVLLRPDDRLDPVAAQESRYFSAAQLDRARDYAGGQRLLALAAIAAQAAVLVLLVWRPPRREVTMIERVARGRVTVATALAGAALILVVTAAALPFLLWAHERAVDVGKSTQSLGEWAQDQFTMAGIAALLAAAAAALFGAVMRRFPRIWWIPGAAIVVAIEVLFVWLAPVVLDPVFNRYTDLPPGRTRDDVTELARRSGVKVGDVLVVDASRRTTSVNAYVTGIGRSKRVVLYDTLLKDFDRDQVRLIVAHELGHVKHRDLARGMLWVAIVAPAGMLVVMLLTRRWSARAGTVPGTTASLPAFALALALVAFGGVVISNQLSRAVEASADTYSLQLTGEPREFISMQQRLSRGNLSDPDPPAFYRALFGTHPTTMRRIGMALAFERER